MAGRKVRSEQDAFRCLDAARAAGAVPGEWARAHGVDGRSLNAWRVNLGRRTRAGASTIPRLVELVPSPPSPPSARYRLHISGVELELGHDFDELTVRRLVGLLRSC